MQKNVAFLIKTCYTLIAKIKEAIFTVKNDFTKEDIKNSIEYQWRKNSAKWLFGLWGVIAVVMLLGTLIVSLDDIKYIGLSFQIWLIVTAIYSALLLPFVAFYCYKMIYLLKHYKQFNSYEVILNNVSTSYAYRGAVYYTVTVNEDGGARQVATNPYFSSGVFAKFTLEDFNNKKVVGLYDSQMDKFYIIKKIT